MADFGERVAWQPERPKFKPLHLLTSWFFTALALYVAAVVSVLNGVLTSIHGLLMGWRHLLLTGDQAQHLAAEAARE